MDFSGGSSAAAGREVFRRGCITCHGPDGRGTPRSTLGFEPPSTFPDFTGGKATAREPNHDWKAIITDGGPARGFSEIMPSFAEALTAEQIDELVQYLRSLCRESSWPRGELNLPRGLMTEKAFPEDEAVKLRNPSPDAMRARDLMVFQAIRNEVPSCVTIPAIETPQPYCGQLPSHLLVVKPALVARVRRVTRSARGKLPSRCLSTNKNSAVPSPAR